MFYFWFKEYIPCRYGFSGIQALQLWKYGIEISPMEEISLTSIATCMISYSTIFASWSARETARWKSLHRALLCYFTMLRLEAYTAKTRTCQERNSFQILVEFHTVLQHTWQALVQDAKALYIANCWKSTRYAYKQRTFEKVKLENVQWIPPLLRTEVVFFKIDSMAQILSKDWFL